MDGLKQAIVELSAIVKAEVSKRPTFDNVQKDILMRNSKLTAEKARLVKQLKLLNDGNDTAAKDKLA